MVIEKLLIKNIECFTRENASYSLLKEYNIDLNIMETSTTTSREIFRWYCAGKFIYQPRFRGRKMSLLMI